MASPYEVVDWPRGILHWVTPRGLQPGADFRPLLSRRRRGRLFQKNPFCLYPLTQRSPSLGVSSDETSHREVSPPVTWPEAFQDHLVPLPSAEVPALPFTANTTALHVHRFTVDVFKYNTLRLGVQEKAHGPSPEAGPRALAHRSSTWASVEGVVCMCLGVAVRYAQVIVYVSARACLSVCGCGVCMCNVRVHGVCTRTCAYVHV